ncbi:FAD-dependent oxidoreductase [Acetobacter oeni]|uniref:Oxidoreductase n=1 Tax=Acetobacter oeni TaxID=304077 RepID=A0A511XMD1_9PROT|nr:FAD-binding protein [Acetobacter oeni]MBB3883698.1 L-aspartate oxidase [Acetobacter oeni]NHO19721.1 FAD-binding protein [Acetobacter oeni]GBR02828.1 succinate dehydrogenase [Acetobacter oeni LMG 21952]GEN64103.1 oxidoreductase [Acetobacter oeni]
MSGAEILSARADVLVLGGGLAGCWAALRAAVLGASVIVAEKGYCGTSGVAATAGPGHWWVPPEKGLRENAVSRRLAAAQGLGDPVWMMRIIERTYETLPSISSHYRYEPDDNGVIRWHALRGPEYLRALRQKVVAAGVRILDHAPAAGLLKDSAGIVTGAHGVLRQGTASEWRVRAGAVVLATGGCAFGSALLGAANNTGDGHLMAAEAGAGMSGMEFSSVFTVAPARTTMTRTMIYSFAHYYDSDGYRIVPPAGPHDNAFLAGALARGPVLCDLSAVPEDIQRQLPQISPNVVVTFRRMGIDPFRQRFPVTLTGEGTIRGVGGIRVTGPDSGCGVPGLFVAGDVASREQVTGPVSGGGAVNSAWALGSGCIAAESAVAFAGINRVLPEPAESRLAERADRAHVAREADLAGLREVIASEMLSPEKQYFRTAGNLLKTEVRLAECHRTLATLRSETTRRGQQKFRELESMLAVARWCTASALARENSLGMHRRTDTSSEEFTPFHITSCGLDMVRTRRVPVEARA